MAWLRLGAECRSASCLPKLGDGLAGTTRTIAGATSKQKIRSKLKIIDRAQLGCSNTVASETSIARHAQLHRSTGLGRLDRNRSQLSPAPGKLSLIVMIGRHFSISRIAYWGRCQPAYLRRCRYWRCFYCTSWYRYRDYWRILHTRWYESVTWSWLCDWTNMHYTSDEISEYCLHPQRARCLD